MTVSDIREHIPNAVIDGRLAPFTFSRNEEENILAEFLRDFDQGREKRGLRSATAGPINNGSPLTGMRPIMAAIQRYGRHGGVGSWRPRARGAGFRGRVAAGCLCPGCVRR